MNSLSWFLYFADVLGRAQVLSIVCAGSAAVSLLGCCMFFSIEKDMLYPHWRAHVATAFFCALVATFIPGQNTIYAIAASQVGEQVIKSETVQGIASDATKALQQWIKRQIDPTK